MLVLSVTGYMTMLVVSIADGMTMLVVSVEVDYVSCWCSS